MPDTRLYGYPDYETYRAIQQRGNERKLWKVWAREANIAAIARYCEARIGAVRSVLCHGTRNGAELRWFASHLSGAPAVLGTDIAQTASRFPNTIVWDFHELRPEWEGAWDLVYSNSWDHAREPSRAFAHWLRSLNPGGLLVLEHGRRHEPDCVSALDPFGATVGGLVRMLDEVDSTRWKVLDVFALPEDERQAIAVGSAR